MTAVLGDELRGLLAGIAGCKGEVSAKVADDLGAFGVSPRSAGLASCFVHFVFPFSQLVNTIIQHYPTLVKSFCKLFQIIFALRPRPFGRGLGSRG